MTEVRLNEQSKANFWQQGKHAKLYSDLLQADEREPMTAPDSPKWTRYVCVRATPLLRDLAPKRNDLLPATELAQYCQLMFRDKGTNKLVNELTTPEGNLPPSLSLSLYDIMDQSMLRENKFKVGRGFACD